MNSFKTQKVISIACSVLVFIFSLFGLIYGLKSVNADGFGQLGVIFIMPSVISLIIIVLDFFITIGKIKIGLIYSFIISLIKIGIIVLLIPITIHEYKYKIQYDSSNFKFDLILIISLIIATIPSILNTINLIFLRKRQ